MSCWIKGKMSARYLWYNTKGMKGAKKDKVERMMLSDFKIYHKAIVIKTVWYW